MAANGDAGNTVFSLVKFLEMRNVNREQKRIQESSQVQKFLSMSTLRNHIRINGKRSVDCEFAVQYIILYEAVTTWMGSKAFDRRSHMRTVASYELEPTCQTLPQTENHVSTWKIL